MTENITSTRFSDPHDVVLKVENERFYVEKSVLRKNCSYFDAMFNGKFVENEQKEVVLEIISAGSMATILDFMYYKTMKFPTLNKVVELIEAAKYFQMEDLIIMIEHALITRLTLLTWSCILKIAKFFNLKLLERRARAFGLYYFNSFRNNLEIIDDLATLHWYLSHKYLNTDDEFDVFIAGCDWLLKNESNDKYKPEENDILVILSCLNFQNIAPHYLENILGHKLVRENESASMVVESIIDKLKETRLEISSATNYKIDHLLHAKREVHDIVCGFLLLSTERLNIEHPCIIRKKKDDHLQLYSPYTNEVIPWKKASDKKWWGHNILVWGGFNIIIVCGEIQIGMRSWNTEILLYNILVEKWSKMNTIPVKPRRHAGAVIHENFLYIIGGVNKYRVTLATVQKYDLNCDTWHSLPDLPEFCQMPVATFHKGYLYVSAQMLYVFRNNEWVHLFKVSMRHNAMISYKNHLYFSQTWKNILSYWEPSSSIEYMRVNEKQLKKSKHHIISMCRIGKHMYFLTEPERFDGQSYCIERCNLDDELNVKTDVLMEADSIHHFSFDPAECLAVPNFDVQDLSINNYGRRWLGNTHQGKYLYFSTEPEKFENVDTDFVFDPATGPNFDMQDLSINTYGRRWLEDDNCNEPKPGCSKDLD